VAELFSESEKVFRLMRYSNIVEFDHKTVVPPPFNLIEFIVRIGFNIYNLALKILKRGFDENTNFGRFIGFFLKISWSNFSIFEKIFLN
jgi:hypothetical protein